MNIKYKLLFSLLAVWSIGDMPVWSQSTVTVGTSIPAAGAGVQYLGDSAAGNVGVQYINSDYIAGDNNASLGQTFTTGTNAGGYLLNSISFMQVASANTFWSGNGTLGFRILQTTAPLSSSGVQGFTLLRQESGLAFLVATSGNSSSGVRGSNAWWVTITLATPIALAANTQYGLDIQSAGTGGNLQFFTEWNGTAADGFGGGQAFGSGSNGNTPDSGSIWLGNGSSSGDRTFVAAMTTATNAPVTTNYVPYTAPLTSADPFPNERVQLLDSRFNQNRELTRSGYLGWLSTNADRLLWPYRDNAGLTQPAGAISLGGWEGGANSSGFTAVRGHMCGHFLSAASRMYADTGDTNFLNTVNYLVTELRKVQNALSTNEIAAGRPYGYLSAFPSSYFTTLETNPTSAQVPFYTIHKILAGLVDAYRFTTNNLALDMAIAMSDYHSWRMSQLSAAQIEAMFVASTGHTEWGGMNETLADLYLLSSARGDTNAARHLTFAEIFHRNWFVNPMSSNNDILATGESGGPMHANTHIPQVVGFARVASILDTNDAQRVRLYAAASNFWHMVIGRHWLVVGGNSYWEHFLTPGLETGIGGNALAYNDAENCNTYNMLKLSRQLFMQNPSVEYADYYEHALYNQMLGAMAPDTGMEAYYVPLNSGNFKTYSQPTGSCWCDTGTGLEIPTRFNEAIYFHKTNVLWVNLFIPSVLDWSECGLSVRLDTGFPATNTIQLTFNCSQPTNVAVRIRIPYWIAATPTVRLNGTDLSLTPAAGTFLELNRTWANGDVVQFTLPMNLRVDHSMDDNSQVSLFYGPILLAGELGTNGMPASDQAADPGAYAGYGTVAVPSLVGDNANDPGNWVFPTSTSLVFTASSAYSGDTGRSLAQLKPYYDIHHERFAVYWNLIAPTGIAVWSGGSPANWSSSGNWNFVPTNQCQVQFGLAGGGSTTNDLAVGTQINGIQFPATAGSYVLNGNSILLQGDVVNNSGAVQQINLPIQLNGGIAWNFNTAAGDLTLGNIVSGIGVLNKTGSHNLTVLSNLTFSGSTHVAAGQLQLGNGGVSGSLGSYAVTVDAGAVLAFNRSDTFQVGSAISGAGSVIKRGAGTMQLTGALSNTGPTVVESGTLQISSQAVPVLKHRWSFNGNLNDSVGVSNAVEVDVGANNTTLTASNITFTGGSQSASDYVQLGSGLLPKDGSPVTIELWATQLGAQNWSRIFDVGSSTSDYLFMSWSQGTDTTQDRVEWKDSVTATTDNTVAPYTPGTEYHIAMVVQPGAGSGGYTRVTWYAAPATYASLGAARGTFDTANALANLNDVNFWLGRSEYGDSTANASYDEVRLWSRAFSTNELQQLHALGPNSVGTFATNNSTGALAAQSDLVLQSGAALDLGGTTQQLASVTGASGSVIQLNGGQLVIGAGTNTATFAGSFSGTGSIQIAGTLRLVGNASIASGIALTNNGTLDIMTWNGALPANFVNHDGTVLDRSLIKLGPCQLSGNDFKVTMQGYSGHTYQLQYRENLTTGDWQSVGSQYQGNDTAIVLVHPGGSSSSRRFYRVIVGP